MRYFCLIFLAAICGCRSSASYPYMNLRHPIYMVAEKSFWSGCDKDPIGEEECRKLRVAQIYAGVNDWFRYFDKTTRPRVIIASKKELPSRSVNQVIYLKIKKGLCNDKDGQHDACYHIGHRARPEMVFDDSSHIYPSMVAHEFGHILGRNHDDFPQSVPSIMLPFVLHSSQVLPEDIEFVCKLHSECPPLVCK